MPFIKQTDRQASRLPVEIGSIFTGRFNEQRFFVEHILTSEIPAAHVIWVWGPAGVGKSTLLTRLRDKAIRSDLKDGWLTAFVDERQGSPADLMERCAVQLRLAGAPLVTFEQAISRYRQTTHHPQPEQVVAQAAFVREVPDLTEAKVMDEAVLGGLYETVVRKANESFGNQQPASQPVGDSRLLNDSLEELTRAFVADLNWLTTVTAPFHTRQIKRGHRVILFFDTFDPSEAEIVDWLLHLMLPAMNNDRVVLVVAGHKPIERTLPDEQMVYLMPIAPFTERETRAYLARCGIIDKDRVASIWHLSGGLPLSVSMLACDPEGPLDEKADVVTNVLQQFEGLDRRMSRPAMQAALCSRPFTQDDLSAFPTLTEQERIDFYRWLIDLPYVQSSVLDGRHRFHPLAQQWFVAAFSRSAPQEEQAARQALARYYQQRLEQLQIAGGRSASFSSEWLELALARASQLFCLMDNASHASAIEQMMEIASEEKQEGEVVTVLRALLQEQSDTLEKTSARRTAQLLLRYIEADLDSEELLTAATGLIELVSHTPTFSETLLARFYNKRGMAYYSRSDYQQAMQDFDQALALDPAYAGAYLLRGMAYSACKEYQQAITDFDQALVLDAGATFAYAHRGIAHLQRKDYEQAIMDFDWTQVLNPQLEGALLLRRLASWELLAYRPGKGEVDQAIKLDPNDAQAYVQRGMASSYLSEGLQAIVDFDRALELDPSDALAYAGRGHVYLEMGEIERARVDLLSSQAFAPNDVYVGLLLVWLDLSQLESLPDGPSFPERLEELAARDQQQPAAPVSRGVSLLLRGHLEEAEGTLDQALLLHPAMREAFFWKSMVCALLQRDEEARAALGQALAGELPLARALLAPLRWLEQKRPDFYRNYAEAVMARSDERLEQ
jgi:tetratricopeptide (TPR) repeat protein